MSDRTAGPSAGEDLPAGWKRAPGSAWLAGTFRFPTASDAASAGGAVAAGLRALGLDGLAMRWKGELLLVRIECRPELAPQMQAAALATLDRTLAHFCAEAVEPLLGSWGTVPEEVRDPRLAQATLHRVSADLARLEAHLEDLAAEASAGAATDGPSDGGHRAFWGFLEAILAQLLIDNFGPLIDDLRTAAVWQPPSEATKDERAA